MNNRNKILIDSFEAGRMPPHDIKLEEAILGAILIDSDAIYMASGLSAEAFYLSIHHEVYKVMLSLFDRKMPIEIITVCNACKKSGISPPKGMTIPFYISSLANSVASSSNVEFHVAILRQMHIQRELIKISTKTIQECYGKTVDVFDTLGSLEKKLTSISGELQSRDVKHISEISNSAVVNYEESLRMGVTGVPCGILDLDKRTGGWQKSDLILIAARPGMGKTSAAIGFAKVASQKHGIPVAIFSCEMSAEQVAVRIISQQSRLSVERIRRRHLLEQEVGEFKSASKEVGELPIFIDDTSSLSIRELRSKASKLKREKGIGLIVIDYIQLMTDNSSGKINRDQEIGNISRALKGIAKDLDVPVIALSQLSRDVEKRGGAKKPVLSDLRESGSLEQDADIVLFIHRPEYYDQNAVDEEGASLKGIAEIIIAKNRNGSLDTIMCEFEGRTTTFRDFNSQF